MPLDQIDIEKDELPAEYRALLKPEPDQAEMSFIEHLDVFRKYLFRSVVVTLLTTTLVAIFISFFFDKVLMAPTQADFISYRVMCQLSELLHTDALCLEVKDVNLHNRQMGGQFTMHITASFIIGFILAFPFIIFQLWQFIRPALYAKERGVASGVVLFCSFFFFLGVGFAYFMVVPLTFQFFTNYSISTAIVDEFDLSSYLSMMVDITLACGIMFQLPMLIYILSKLGIIGPEFLKTYRRHAYLAILIASAVLTPSDVLSMILLALPLMLLYELSIVLSKTVKKKQPSNEN